MLTFKGNEIVFGRDQLELFNGAVVVLKNFDPKRYWNKLTGHSSISGNLEIDRNEEWRYVQLPYSSIAEVWVCKGQASDNEILISVVDVIVRYGNTAYRIARGEASDTEFLTRLNVVLDLFRQHSVKISRDGLDNR